MARLWFRLVVPLFTLIWMGGCFQVPDDPEWLEKYTPDASATVDDDTASDTVDLDPEDVDVPQRAPDTQRDEVDPTDTDNVEDASDADVPDDPEDTSPDIQDAGDDIEPTDASSPDDVEDTEPDTAPGCGLAPCDEEGAVQCDLSSGTGFQRCAPHDGCEGLRWSDAIDGCVIDGVCISQGEPSATTTISVS